MAESGNHSFNAVLTAALASARNEAARVPRFKCPYFNMFSEAGAKTRACNGEGFTSVYRMKEHLYRAHASPMTCPRCFDTFMDQTQINAHLRNETICPLEAAPFIDEITTFSEAKKQELKRRPNKGHNGEEGLCKEIYKILFPGKPIPESLYVTNSFEHGQKHQALTRDVFHFLKETLPKDPKYAELSNAWTVFSEKARATGIVQEAAKRRKISNHHTPRVDSVANADAFVTGRPQEDVSQPAGTTATAPNPALALPLPQPQPQQEPIDDFVQWNFDVPEMSFNSEASKHTEYYPDGWSMVEPKDTIAPSESQ